MSTPAISIQNVSKRFGLSNGGPSSIKEAILSRRRSTEREFWALQDVSFDIPRGSFFGIIGHNGSGKSTLLKLTAGIHRPTSGSIVANGRISALLELGSGFHPDLTGRENVFLNGAILGLSQKHMAKAIDEIAEFSGIGEFIDAPVKVYSSGMHVRLGFAIAVHVEPEILLVDEVLAVGDEAFQRKCFDHIYNLRRKGTTIVLVSHDSASMDRLCDEVAWLDHGELQAVGDVSQTLRSYISQVNADEQERLAEDSSLEVETEDEYAGQDDRRGSGEVRITGFTLLNENGKEVTATRSGDEVTVRLYYEATESIVAPIIGLMIHHENGTHIGSTNNLYDGGHDGDLAAGAGHIDVQIPRLQLMPGPYLLTTGILSPDQLHFYDAWERFGRLTVQPGDLSHHDGLFELVVDWSDAKPGKRRIKPDSTKRARTNPDQKDVGRPDQNDAAPDDTARDHTAPDDTARDNTAPDDTARDEAAPDDAPRDPSPTREFLHIEPT